MSHGGSRIGAGRPKKGEIKPTASRAKDAGTIASPMPDRSSVVADGVVTERSPLQYMLDVMNDPGADERLRSQMAVAAAPYMHAKKGESTGKKGEQADKAKQAAGGRFAPAAPPLKLVGRR